MKGAERIVILARLVVLLSVAAVASRMPAQRAVQTDPAMVLRDE